MNDWIEWALIAFITGGIVLAVWKGGAANPEGTGSLGRKVTGLSGRVAHLDTRLGHVESELADVVRDGATTKDIARLEERMGTLKAEMSGHRELAERTWKSVDRIERFLIEKGLGK